ncbi:MAG: 4-hydroxythreonine-4-phosphate dehydrogenase PdxA [Pseudanabaenaceae cyanobacterium]
MQANTHESLKKVENLRLGLTVGDPCGIGTEIILKALAEPAIARAGVELIIYGDRAHIETAYQQLLPRSPLPLADPQSLTIVDVHPQGGDPSFVYLERAITDALAGAIAGIVTAPIAKVNWHRAGHYYPGQTELLAERSGTKKVGMLFVARSPHTGWQLRVLLATVHIPLAQVCQVLSPTLITEKLDLLVASLASDFGLTAGTIAIAGINPHSGEGGQLGREEVDWLIPTLHRWQKAHPHWQVSDPIPPDALWVKAAQAWQDPLAVATAPTAYLAMYHDQGLIPVKMLGFAYAVNTTIGLPFVRTSPDHGTAFDIAGKGIADPSSYIQAIQLAIALVQQRQRYSSLEKV